MEQIDKGGNGTVWKAEAPGDSCVYAVKVLNDGTSKNAEKLARFSPAAGILSRYHNCPAARRFPSSQCWKYARQDPFAPPKPDREALPPSDF